MVFARRDRRAHVSNALGRSDPFAVQPMFEQRTIHTASVAETIEFDDVERGFAGLRWVESVLYFAAGNIEDGAVIAARGEW